MEALKVKYEQNRAEVLKSLDVSKELLEVMTRHGLVDIADCVKYQVWEGPEVAPISVAMNVRACC